MDEDPSGERAGKQAPQRPRRYAVVLLPDPPTPPGMVLRLLRTVFNLPADEALAVMLAAGRTGARTIGAYTKEVAETKAKMSEIFAQEECKTVAVRVEPAK